MPQPTPNQLHVERFLTNLAVAWAQKQENFIADKVFPLVPVLKESDLIPIYKKGFFYRDELKVRPLGGRPAQIGYEIEHGRYHANEWSAEHKIDDRVRANADVPLDPDRAAMRQLTQQALIRRDVIWTTKFFTTGVWGTDWLGVEKSTEAKAEEHKFLMFDQAGSEPITFFDERKIDIAGKTGYTPNILVLGADAYRTIKNHSAVLDRIKYTQRGLVTRDLLAELFDLEQVLVPFSVVNTAQEGATDSINFIVGRNDALLVYAAPAPSIEEPSAGYTFAYTGLIPGLTNAFGGVIEKGREELAHSDVIQIRAAYDVQQLATDLGQFFDGLVAPVS